MLIFIYLINKINIQYTGLHTGATHTNKTQRETKHFFNVRQNTTWEKTTDP